MNNAKFLPRHQVLSAHVMGKQQFMLYFGSLFEKNNINLDGISFPATYESVRRILVEGAKHEKFAWYLYNSDFPLSVLKEEEPFDIDKYIDAMVF